MSIKLLSLSANTASPLLRLVSQEVPLLSKHIPVLVQFFLECSVNKAYDDELCIMVLNALSWMVK